MEDHDRAAVFAGHVLGAMWGTEVASRMLADAGFGQVEIIESPRPQNCIYACRA